jgi:hypothetical protein
VDCLCHKTNEYGNITFDNGFAAWSAQS